MLALKLRWIVDVESVLQMWYKLLLLSLYKCHFVFEKHWYNHGNEQ